jgi:hypothetical protein
MKTCGELSASVSRSGRSTHPVPTNTGKKPFWRNNNIIATTTTFITTTIIIIIIIQRYSSLKTGSGTHRVTQNSVGEGWF